MEEMPRKNGRRSGRLTRSVPYPAPPFGGQQLRKRPNESNSGRRAPQRSRYSTRIDPHPSYTPSLTGKLHLSRR